LEKLHLKLELLKHKKNSRKLVKLPENKKSIVMNLLKAMLDTLEHNVLEKGFMFLVVPNNIIVEDLECNIESSLISKKKIENVETIR
jgi:hypothetical protein